MNIRELILESNEILEKVDNSQVINIDFLCKSLNINRNELMQYFEDENIFIASKSKSTISSDLIKQLILCQSQISSPPSNIRDLILNSDTMISRIRDKKQIRVIKICRILNISLRNLKNLLIQEGIEISGKPGDKLNLNHLRKFIEPKDDSLKNNTEQILISLENKINQKDNKEYVRSIVLNQFTRSEQIREYAKIRAKGICELCEKPAPFLDKYGIPFLEVHHIIYLSRGGTDTINNVAAVCPNCHRKIHNLNTQEDIEKLLDKRREEI